MQRRQAARIAQATWPDEVVAMTAAWVPSMQERCRGLREWRKVLLIGNEAGADGMRGQAAFKTESTVIRGKSQLEHRRPGGLALRRLWGRRGKVALELHDSLTVVGGGGGALVTAGAVVHLLNRGDRRLADARAAQEGQRSFVS